jgi:hypothetical protein
MEMPNCMRNTINMYPSRFHDKEWSHILSPPSTNRNLSLHIGDPNCIPSILDRSSAEGIAIRKEFVP